MLYLLSPFSTPLAVVWMNVVCWLKILVQKCRRRRCCYSDMLLLITLIALACLCDSHRRLQCTRCVCVLCMQECVSVSCIRALDVTVCLCMCVCGAAAETAAVAFQFQFCNFGSCQVALSLQLSAIPFPLCPTVCLAVPLALSVCLSDGQFPISWQAGRQLFPFPIPRLRPMQKPFYRFCPSSIHWLTDLRSCFPRPFSLPIK